MCCSSNTTDRHHACTHMQVWDFDWSLVEENSDTWVLQRLGGAARFERLHALASRVSRKAPASAPSTFTGSR